MNNKMNDHPKSICMNPETEEYIQSIHIYFDRKKKQPISPLKIVLISSLASLLVIGIVLAIVMPLILNKSKYFFGFTD
jgi:hypothetical protein